MVGRHALKRDRGAEPFEVRRQFGPGLPFGLVVDRGANGREGHEFRKIERLQTSHHCFRQGETDDAERLGGSRLVGNTHTLRYERRGGGEFARVGPALDDGRDQLQADDVIAGLGGGARQGRAERLAEKHEAVDGGFEPEEVGRLVHGGDPRGARRDGCSRAKRVPGSGIIEPQAGITCRGDRLGELPPRFAHGKLFEPPGRTKHNPDLAGGRVQKPRAIIEGNRHAAGNLLRRWAGPGLH